MIYGLGRINRTNLAVSSYASLAVYPVSSPSFYVCAQRDWVFRSWRMVMKGGETFAEANAWFPLIGEDPCHIHEGFHGLQ